MAKCFSCETWLRITTQALEQGIDQMRSVPGQDIKMTIEPGTKPLHSIVKLTVEQKGFVHGSLMLIILEINQQEHIKGQYIYLSVNWQD